jgi:HPt (histidine-containing phosphotransfer) domain-containing protein
MGSSKETHINLKQMAENVGLEEDEYLSLLTLFIETTIYYLSELKSAIHNGDSKKVYETIHTIRGAAENLGIPDISEIAKTIEMKARQNILEGAEEATECLVKEIEYITEVYH